MSDSLAAHNSHTDASMARLQKALDIVLGTNRRMRDSTTLILLSGLMYAVCCGVAAYAAEIGMMLSIGPSVLVATAIPAHLIFYGLVRSGISRRWNDSGLMVVQNIYALLAIAFAYITLAPSDRSMVFVLVPVVIVFGMYTFSPAQSMACGIAALCLLGASLGILSRYDPVFYPANLELLRFLFMFGSLPMLALTAYLLISWRQRLDVRRKELMATLNQVQILATRDSLTGLYNRRHMHELIENKVERFHRYGEGFTLALMDLDHFKRINDQYGHQVGDQALITFANSVASVLRDTDAVGRWGGEEFVCVMPNTTPDKALVALERIREVLSQAEVDPKAPHLRVKFSAGLALYEGQDSSEQTVERADQALYKAKGSGRNQSCVAPQADELV